MVNNRIYGQNININESSVKEFFDKNVSINKRSLKSVNLQSDENLSIARDLAEKNILLKMLDLSGSEKVLDIGCGFGRIADVLQDKVFRYLGLDFCEELIKIAQDKFKDNNNVAFQVMSATQIEEQLLLSKPPFDIIIVAGLMVYINDDECKNLIKKISTLLSKNSKIYIKESISVIENRLTLKDFYSQDLESNYSSIYRTEKEYIDIFSILLEEGFEIIKTNLITKDNLSNRLETGQKYWLLEKK